MSVQALHDYILVIPNEAPKDQQRASGLYIPDNIAAQRTRIVFGRIIAVGPGKKLDSGERAPMDVEVGQMIAFPDLAGWEFEQDEHTHRMIRETDVLFIQLPRIVSKTLEELSVEEEREIEEPLSRTA